MRNYTVFFLLIFSFNLSFSQEICDNGIDDDGNGLVDINDPACDCNIIPNPSFENYYSCPTVPKQVDFLYNWISASNTPDYYNSCGYTSQVTNGNSPFPLPGGGNGYVGSGYSTLNSEYAGVCLNYPLIAGQQYTLTMYVARNTGSTTLDLGLFGTSNCNDMPWTNSNCPVGQGSWVELDNQVINLGSPNTIYSWHPCTFTFTPTVNTSAITIGGRCNYSGPGGYFLMDNLKILPDSSQGLITRKGNLCDSNLTLTANSNIQNGAYQWYLDGVALLGEINNFLNVTQYGVGTYSYRITTGTGCERADYDITTATIIPAFTFANQCINDSVIFNDNSTISSGSITDYYWNFGDNSGNSSLQHPSHIYNSPGSYNVSLMVTSDSNCVVSTIENVTVHSKPTANFSFNFSCENSPTLFNNSSFPISNSSWFWDFDQDGIPDDNIQNPTHTFTSPINNYPVNLLIIDSNNCRNDTTIDVVINPLPKIDLMNDTLICPGDNLLLNVEFQNATYLWQDGSVNSSLLINQPGSYWVTADLNSCIKSDTVNIEFYKKIPYLGKDTVLCDKDILHLDLSYLNEIYHWQDNSSSSFYNISEIGSYWITIESLCGVYNDSINVSFKDCSCSLYVPNSFTPNNDGVNDNFFINLSCPLEEFDFTIFNRFGEIIFNAKNVSDSWDGTYMGKEVPVDTYAYKLTYKSERTSRVYKYGKINLFK
jgi:gliding motility-associated-like protein